MFERPMTGQARSPTAGASDHLRRRQPSAGRVESLDCGLNTSRWRTVPRRLGLDETSDFWGPFGQLRHTPLQCYCVTIVMLPERTSPCWPLLTVAKSDIV